jgi:uncharacterized protein (DUF1330 family)
MPAYLLVDTKIHDDETYETYKKGARPIAERHGGEYVARGGDLDVLEDDLWTPTRLVIIRFPDMASARAFADDPEYLPFKKMRQGSAKCTVAIVDGF